MVGFISSTFYVVLLAVAILASASITLQIELLNMQVHNYLLLFIFINRKKIIKPYVIQIPFYQFVYLDNKAMCLQYTQLPHIVSYTIYATSDQFDFGLIT